MRRSTTIAVILLLHYDILLYLIQNGFTFKMMYCFKISFLTLLIFFFRPLRQNGNANGLS